MLRLERRPEASHLMSYASPAIAIVLMLIGGLFLFAFLGKNPIDGFKRQDLKKRVQSREAEREMARFNRR